ncbi:hypothetical protein DFQ29_001000, partial [Apophysomyces sp. BC1021]
LDRVQVAYGATKKDEEFEDSEGEGDSEGDQYLFDASDKEEFSELESEVEGNFSGYKSDDMLFDYPYDPGHIHNSSPLMIPVELKGYHLMNAVTDTGAGPSLISAPLAKKLGLQVNKDRMVIELLDETLSAPNGICENVL